MSEENQYNNADNEGRVRVFIRVRPPDFKEKKEDPGNHINILDEKNIHISKSSWEKKKFVFDHIFPIQTSQEQVYKKAGEDIIKDVLNGYHGTVFVYGQTGTGKTHTLTCDEKGWEGIIPRSVKHLFELIEEDTDHEYTINMNYIQIYMETIQDLLWPESENLQIRQDDSGIHVVGVRNQPVNSPEEFFQHYNAGNENRITALTKMNAHSSRSHTCLILNINKRSKITDDDEEIHDQTILKGKLFLFDLAGSERVKKTGAEGIRMEEAKAINSSLSNLGNVIHALTDPKATHVPYRDSKLTRLLQDSLGGGGKTHLIVTIGPSFRHVKETLSSLQFGSRAMRVIGSVKKHQDIDYKALSIKLQALLDEAESKIYSLSHQIEERKDYTQQLEAECIILQEKLNSQDRVFDSENLQSIREIFPQICLDNQTPAEIMQQIQNQVVKMKNNYEDQIAKLKDEHKKDIQRIEDEFTLEIEDCEKNIRAYKNNIQKLEKKIENHKNSNLKNEESINGQSTSTNIVYQQFSQKNEYKNTMNFENAEMNPKNILSNINTEIERYQEHLEPRHHQTIKEVNHLEKMLEYITGVSFESESYHDVNLKQHEEGETFEDIKDGIMCVSSTITQNLRNYFRQIDQFTMKFDSTADLLSAVFDQSSDVTSSQDGKNQDNYWNLNNSSNNLEPSLNESQNNEDSNEVEEYISSLIQSEQSKGNNLTRESQNCLDSDDDHDSLFEKDKMIFWNPYSVILFHFLNESIKKENKSSKHLEEFRDQDNIPELLDLFNFVHNTTKRLRRFYFYQVMSSLVIRSLIQMIDSIRGKLKNEVQTRKQLENDFKMYKKCLQVSVQDLLKTRQRFSEISEHWNDFMDYMEEQEKSRQKDRAARIIQRTYKQIKLRIQMKEMYEEKKKISQKVRAQKTRLEEYEQYKEMYEHSNAQTGFLLMKRSFIEVETFFETLIHHFEIEEKYPYEIDTTTDESSSHSSPLVQRKQNSTTNSTTFGTPPKFSSD
eukprot:gb/GECH01009288.1/.p1 GENE.gb/GECH01009288.1/~~gb/GECH01009288.1/.p1  ORF type:complete len:1001 (+),score=267.65 gb/GECH01009288.1/:1-3003(+)